MSNFSSKTFTDMRNGIRFTFLLMVMTLMSNFGLYAQCTNSTSYGSAVAPGPGLSATMTSCNFGGEYGTVTSATAATSYTVTGTGGAGNYFTIRQGTPSGPVIASGFSPLIITTTAAGTYYTHINTTAACGTDAVCHTVSITNNTVVPASCTNTTGFGGAVAPGPGLSATITSCNFGGEYGTVTAATAATSYTVTGTGGTGNYFTIRQGTPAGALIASGPSPLTFTSTVAGTYYTHINTTAACGTDVSCHNVSITNNTVVSADPCASITTIACTTPTTATLTGAGAWSPGACGFTTPGNEKVYSFTPTVTGVHSLQVTAASGGFVDYMYKAASGGCGATGWTCIIDVASTTTATIGTLTAGVEYYILMDAESLTGATQTFQINCPLPPTGPCASITTIACATPATGVLTGAGVLSPGACGFTTPGNEKIFSFTPTVTGVHSLQVTATNAGGYIDYMYKAASGGCSATGWTCILDIFSPTTTTIGTLTAGVEYYILMDAESLAGATHTFQINCPVACPAATIAYSGSPYCTSAGVVSVVRTGTSGGTYTASPAGLTINASTGAITPATSAAGAYTVTYTIAAAGPCPVFTTTASITINLTPDVNQPVNQVVCNNVATLPINFTGTANTNFNWVNNTTSIGLAASGTGNIASFTALNTTTAPISATITVTPVTAGGGGPVTTTFANSATVAIPGTGTTGPGAPYPSNITVSGTSGTITNLTVKLKNLNHTFPSDIDMLLVGPSGQNSIIMSDVGSGTDLVNVDLVLDDAAANMSTAAIVSGTYKPTDLTTGDAFPAPAPAPSGNVPLNIFNGTSANGTWSLYIVDDSGGDSGSMIDGWELNITTGASAVCPGVPKTFTITVNPTAVVTAVTNKTFCNGATTGVTTFSSPNTGGTVSYSWTNSNPAIGLVASGAGNLPTFTATNAGVAPITATITVTPSFTNAGVTCSGTAITFTITVNPTPTVNVVADQTVCANTATAAVNFTGAVAGTVYSWTNSNPAIGLAASGTGNIPSFVATNGAATPISATITVTPNYGATPTCSGTPRTFTITVNPLTVVTCPGNITVTSVLGTCTAAVTYTATVTGTPAPVVTYTFSGATIGSGAGTGSGALFNVGVTTVTVIATNTCGVKTCTFTITVNDAQPPAVTTQPVTKTFCEGTSATFTVTATNAVSYQWEKYNGSTWVSVPGATSATLTVNAVTLSMNTDTYRAKVIGLCTTVTSGSATLYVNPKPNVSIISSQTLLVPGSAFNLTAITNGTGAGTYIWYKNGAVVAGVSGKILAGGRIDDRATYKVTYTDANGCTNTSADFTVGSLQTTELFIYPNPNNGQFQIRFYNLPNESATVYIYNSGGQIVLKKVIPTGSLPYSQMSVNISNQAGGVYVIKLINGAGKELGNTRIIKQ